MNSNTDALTQRAVAHVLLVDDEAKLRESLAQGLRLEDWDVVTAGTGGEAMKRARAEHFDLVILDWMLPDIDGLDVLRAIRKDAPRLPVLMITARTMRADQMIARESGVSDFLTKPFSFSDLVDRCRALLAAQGSG